SWGPRIRPPFHHLSDHDPLLIVLKAGYAPTTLANKFTMDWKNDNRGMFHTSDWNGKTLKLEKAPSDLKILAGLYADAQVTLHYQTGDWRKYPRTTLFIDKQVERLYQMGLKSTILDRMFVTEELSEADKKRLQRYEP
ncbi:MAG: hypothetical protein OEY67_04740, partial [Gammaproteobacteria bacterium]|nr:hypothetical protein [Gammaproteobacteria bacterium]